MNVEKKEQKKKSILRKKQTKEKEDKQMGTIRSYCFTTSEFWDCECKEDYIHPASQTYCIHCRAHRDDMPDSRVDEVEALLGIRIPWKVIIIKE
jgi:hypothetical protein